MIYDNLDDYFESNEMFYRKQFNHFTYIQIVSENIFKDGQRFTFPICQKDMTKAFVFSLHKARDITWTNFIHMV